MDIYQQLKELVGEPVKTERMYMGLSACRMDTFPCGCVRAYIARVGPAGGEGEERLYPCEEHKHLVPAPVEKVQDTPSLQPRMF